jgi:hypothetical protein
MLLGKRIDFWHSHGYISKTRFRPIELALAIRTHRSAIEPIEPIERHSIGQNIWLL